MADPVMGGFVVRQPQLRRSIILRKSSSIPTGLCVAGAVDGALNLPPSG